MEPEVAPAGCSGFWHLMVAIKHPTCFLWSGYDFSDGSGGYRMFCFVDDGDFVVWRFPSGCADFSIPRWHIGDDRYLGTAEDFCQADSETTLEGCKDFRRTRCTKT